LSSMRCITGSTSIDAYRRSAMPALQSAPASALTGICIKKPRA
jgi:hypothetical protein